MSGFVVIHWLPAVYEASYTYLYIRVHCVCHGMLVHAFRRPVAGLSRNLSSLLVFIKHDTIDLHQRTEDSHVLNFAHFAIPCLLMWRVGQVEAVFLFVFLSFGVLSISLDLWTVLIPSLFLIFIRLMKFGARAIQVASYCRSCCIAAWSVQVGNALWSGFFETLDRLDLVSHDLRLKYYMYLYVIPIHKYDVTIAAQS